MSKSTNLTATELCRIAAQDRTAFLARVEAPDFLSSTRWDNQLRSIDVAIFLRDMDRPELAIFVLDHLAIVFRNSHLVHHQAGTCYARSLNFERAAEEGRRAVQLEPRNVHNIALMARAYALAGDISTARSVLQNLNFSNLDERRYIAQIVQFINFLGNWHIRHAYDALHELEYTKRYITPIEVIEKILTAVHDKRPYSFLRLGDGEGAWLSLSAYDEGCYQAIYDANRRSFLKDWFGTETLINDWGFSDFALRLQQTYRDHDIIGISPLARLDQECSFLSIRGITSSMNILRHLDLLDHEIKGRQFYCSSSANLDLLGLNFFRKIRSFDCSINIVTSQPGLAPILAANGLFIDEVHIIPGDSRNFMRDAPDAEPVCQYPNYLERIDSHLASQSQSGRLFLVGGGFVGKKYLSTIKRQGGVAIDIGSVADHIVRRGSV